MKGHSHASPTKPHPRAVCIEKNCRARLLTPTPDGRCRFCRIELKLEKPV